MTEGRCTSAQSPSFSTTQCREVTSAVKSLVPSMTLSEMRNDKFCQSSHFVALPKPPVSRPKRAWYIPLGNAHLAVSCVPIRKGRFPHFTAETPRKACEVIRSAWLSRTGCPPLGNQVLSKIVFLRRSRRLGGEKHLGSSREITPASAANTSYHHAVECSPRTRPGPPAARGVAPPEPRPPRDRSSAPAAARRTLLPPHLPPPLRRR